MGELYGRRDGYLILMMPFNPLTWPEYPSMLPYHDNVKVAFYQDCVLSEANEDYY